MSYRFGSTLIRSRLSSPKADSPGGPVTLSEGTSHSTIEDGPPVCGTAGTRLRVGKNPSSPYPQTKQVTVVSCVGMTHGHNTVHTVFHTVLSLIVSLDQGLGPRTTTSTFPSFLTQREGVLSLRYRGRRNRKGGK